MLRKKTILTAVALFAAASMFHCFSRNPDVPGLPKNNQLVIIGDSIFALNGEEKLQIARNAGENSRGYATSGAQMSGISDQYTRAKREGSVRTIIMDGGGNNVLQGGQDACAANSPSQVGAECLAILQTAWDIGAVLLNRMWRDGVQDVVWQGYYELPGSNARLNAALAVGVEGLRDICEDAPADCTFVDLTTVFRGQSGTVIFDNIHPTTKGSRILGDTVWAAMVAGGIEQNQ
ncbi:MAG: SGNH/GDSL hydrolase family protein [bacterium]|nr:SGNH/GDSL hydrolase family protein [bacterium]